MVHKAVLDELHNIMYIDSVLNGIVDTDEKKEMSGCLPINGQCLLGKSTVRKL